MNTQEKKEYSAPTLTVVSVKSERGYVASNFALLSLWMTPAEQQVESYNVHDNWGDDAYNNFF